jgi:hypothetical protein
MCGCAAIIDMGRPGAKEETLLQDSLYETEWILLDCVGALLKKTGTDPKEVSYSLDSILQDIVHAMRGACLRQNCNIRGDHAKVFLEILLSLLLFKVFHF